MLFETLYTSLEPSFVEKLKQIKLLVCDVDGVFSDGRIYLGNQGEELKAFNTKDGYGIKALIHSGVEVAVITGRRSILVEQRMSALSIKYIIQGEINKKHALQKLMQKLNLTSEHVASMGDDIPDTGMFEESSVNIAVKDAHPLVLKAANWTTTINGGYGAVREVCDTILQVNSNLNGIQAASI